MSLSAGHDKMLKDSGISEDVIRERGYKTVTQKPELLTLGFKDYQARVPGLLIPICSPSGEVVSHQYRPDNPRKSSAGKCVKYESLAGRPSRLDVPPSVRCLIGDPDEPLWISEGVKKADSAASRGRVCVALPGVWNFKGRNVAGGSVVIGDFDQVALKDRPVYIAFDSDADHNKSVKLAEERLFGILRSKGALPQIVRIPTGADGQKRGLDDYLVEGGTLEWLIEHALVGGPEKQEKKDAAARLLELVEAEGVELWHGADDEAFASFRQGRAVLHAPVRSRSFKTYCAGLFYRRTGRGLSEQTEGAVLNSLAARALHDGPCRQVERRVGWHQDEVYLALHDDLGRVVVATAEGWRLMDGAAAPIRFVRASSARPLPEPQRGGRMEELRPFINVEDEDWPLIVAFLIGCFLPSGTFAILGASGEQGSGKSFGCGLLRNLVDPKEPPLRKKPKDYQDLMAALNGGYLLGFDNLSGLSSDLSDSLCSIASGAGFSARTLYTNAEETTIQARRPILLNGIGEVVTRPDLADRTLRVEFRPLDADRRSERDLREEFERARPRILGAVLGRVVLALSKWKNVEPVGIRLHDFGQWTQAACTQEEESILRQALLRNRADLEGAAIEHDAFATALLALFENDGELHLSAGELLDRMNARRDPGSRLPHDWPKNARAASSQLARIAPALRRAGYEVERAKRSERQRPWLIRRTTTVDAAQPSGPSEQSFQSLIEPGWDPSNDDGHDAGGESCG